MEPHKTVFVDVVTTSRRRAFSKAAARADKTENELFLELLEKRIEQAERTFDFRFQVPAGLYDRARAVANVSNISIEPIFREIVAPEPLKFRTAQEETKRASKTRMLSRNILIERQLVEAVRRETSRRRMKIKDFVRIALENKLTGLENERCDHVK